MSKGSNYADGIVDLYSQLQQQIFDKIINILNQSNYSEVNADNVMEWQLDQLSKAGMLTEQVIDLVAKVNGQTPQMVKKMCNSLGIESSTEAQKDIKNNTKNNNPIVPDTKQIVSSYVNQTQYELANNVNETLLTRNTANNTAVRVFRDVVTKSSLEVSSGLKTADRAVRDNIYRWIDKGIPTRLTDRAGRGWSLEAYSRMVVRNTSKRVMDDIRDETMDINDCVLAKMSWHAAAREACATIQGNLVNMVPENDPRFNPKYDSIYNHDYGKPGGTRGINCRHTFTPFDPDVNIFRKDKRMPSPEEAMRNEKVQQHQRLMERSIRQTKSKLHAAQQLDDTSKVSILNRTLHNQQANLRSLVSEHEFLHRDYTREQVYDKN
jgi:hypothetical protein